MLTLCYIQSCRTQDILFTCYVFDHVLEGEGLESRLSHML